MFVLKIMYGNVFFLLQNEGYRVINYPRSRFNSISLLKLDIFMSYIFSTGTIPSSFRKYNASVFIKHLY